MKKITSWFIGTLLLMVSANTLMAQAAKKPTIMVVPSKNWCVENGFTKTYSNQGKTEILLVD
jgi:hypothetical protein